jgi:hypothetical protein
MRDILAMKRRVSSKTASSLIHAGRGRLRTSVMWDIAKRWSSAKYDNAAVHWQRTGVGALQALHAECAYSRVIVRFAFATRV